MGATKEELVSRGIPKQSAKSFLSHRNKLLGKSGFQSETEDSEPESKKENTNTQALSVKSMPTIKLVHRGRPVGSSPPDSPNLNLNDDRTLVGGRWVLRPSRDYESSV